MRLPEFHRSRWWTGLKRFLREERPLIAGLALLLLGATGTILIGPPHSWPRPHGGVPARAVLPARHLTVPAAVEALHTTPSHRTPSPVQTVKPPSFATPPGRASTPEPGPWRWPVVGRVIVGYGWTEAPALGEWVYHGALDLGAPPGTPVAAATAGTITAVENNPLYGLSVEETVPGGMLAVYSDLGEVFVRVGSAVPAGAVIGTVGRPGYAELTEEPHLHFAVLRGTVPEDPLLFLPPVSKP